MVNLKYVIYFSHYYYFIHCLAFYIQKNEIYIRVRKYIDIATIVVTSILVITWVEVFDYSF